MENGLNFNKYFYEILASMIETAKILYEEDEDNEPGVLDFYNKIEKALEKMDKEEIFEDNLISFCSTLSPTEEDILFYNLAVTYYENWCEVSQDEEMQEDKLERVNIWAQIIASRNIIEMLDNYLGYGYFDEDEEEYE